jgi:transcriptional regulator with XRE-family HTH domain
MNEYLLSQVERCDCRLPIGGMTLRSTFATNLRKMRMARCYTQEQLSARAEVNRNYTGMIEREERSPTLDVVEKLAAALDVEPSVLLLDGGSTKGATSRGS